MYKILFKKTLFPKQNIRTIGIGNQIELNEGISKVKSLNKENNRYY